MKFNYDDNPNTKEFWDSYYRKRKVERKNLWLFDTVIQYLRGYTKPDAIEIGCGAGRTIIELWKMRKDVNWVGLDFSETAIATAIKKFGTRAKFIRADIVQMSLKRWPNKPYYNFILCAETLEHLDEPEKVCGLMWSWLRPEGTILITVPVAGTPLDKNPGNLHNITFQPEDFEGLFPEGRVNTFKIDKHHLVVTVKK